MKIKQGYMLRQVAKQTVVLPVVGDLELNKMMTLNSTGKFLWEQLQTECQPEGLVAAMLEKYDVDEATARTCVTNFIKRLEHNGFLD